MRHAFALPETASPTCRAERLGSRAPCTFRLLRDSKAKDVGAVMIHRPSLIPVRGQQW
jgi:hypothetical protein